MGDEAPDFGQVWLGLNDTAAEDGYFPIIGSVSTLSTATFSPKVTIGDYTKDADDYISTLIISDLSGGINVEDMNEGSDTNRCWTAFADIRKPGKIAHNTRVEQLSIPSGASGTAYSCGQILNTPYVIFGTKVYGRKESDGTWYSGVNFTLTPVGKPVAFAGKIFVPCGASGYAVISEADSIANPGVPTVTNITSGVQAYPASYVAATPDTNPPTAIAFTVFDQKLWALSTGGAICTRNVDGTDTWLWYYDEARGWYPKINPGESPRRIIPFPNMEGNTKVYATSNRGGYVYEQSAPPSLQSTPIQVAPHPDNGGAVAVWRAGEDLHIANGLDIIRYTSAGVVVPLAGLARDDGMPQELWGRIVDLEPETSELLALVGPITGGGASYLAYDLKFGTDGSGNTNFANPDQIARDSSGNIYIADTGNNRLKKHQADGTYVSAITGRTDVTGVCLDAIDRVYTCYATSLQAYSSGHVSLWSVGLAATGRHVATTGSSVFVTTSADTVQVRVLSTGALSSTIGSTGSGDGQFNTPYGIATDGTYLYVVDQGNTRIQKFTTAGVFVTKWGTSGTGDGQFTTPVAIAVNPVSGNIYVTDTGRDDIQEFTNTGSFVRKFSSLGSGDGQVNNPTGVVVTANGESVYVADQGNDRVTKFTTDTTATTQGQTYPGLYGWTGIGWYGKWKGSTLGVNPNWMHVTATDHAYRAYWGMDDGYCYTTKLRRYFHNPRRGFIAGEDEFESTSEIITSKFDAAMLGNWKIADHMVVFMEHASATEYITIEYTTDADSGWTLLGTVNSTTKTYLPFALDAVNGFSEGVPFNWIQFRIRGFSTDSIYKCPLIKSIVFAFIKIPQNTNAFQFVVAFPNEHFKGRSGAAIRAALDSLITARQMIKMRLHEWDGDQREFRGYLTSVSGEDAASDEAGGSRAINFIELRASES